MRRLFAWHALVLIALSGRAWSADGSAPPVAPPVPPAEVPADAAPEEKPSLIAGRLVRVPLPITDSDSTDTQVKRAIQRALADLAKEGAQRPVLVLEFVPEKGQFGEGTDFGRALSLAQFLSSRDLAGVKTVAFVPRSIKGHGVLMVMACEEIVMAADSELGEAGIDQRPDEGVDPTVLSGYKQIADRRRTVPPQVALGMIDKDVEVLKVETEVSPEFVLQSELAELKKKHAIQGQTVLKRTGEFGKFSGREGRELGFVKFLAADRNALAQAMGLSPAAIEEDPAAGGEWRPIRVPIKGIINAPLVNRVERMIEDQVRDGDINFICVMIDSPGGSWEQSMELANFLAEQNKGRVRTVAFIPREARGDAALIALGCDQIVMGPNATLGGSGAQAMNKDRIEAVRTTIRESLSPQKTRSWSLSAALVDPDLHVFRYTRKGDGRVEYYSPDEVAALPDPNVWTKGDELLHHGPLKLRGERALDVGLAKNLAADFHAFKQLYGLERDPRLVEPSWADYLIDRLASPGVGWLLLLVGLAALYAELQAPGIGVGGFIAGVCFLLFFWNRYLEGTAEWLEVMLFVGGVACVLIEIFVLPGVAIFGLGGGLMILASLILASQTFVLPHNDYQWDQLQSSLLSLLAVSAGFVAAVALIRRYLPHTPWISGMLLAPPSGEEMQTISQRESVVDFRHLLGQQGTAATHLMPSGKARFGMQLVDVTVDGDVIDRGQEVVVTAVHGNRVVVKSVR